MLFRSPVTAANSGRRVATSGRVPARHRSQPPPSRRAVLHPCRSCRLVACEAWPPPALLVEELAFEAYLLAPRCSPRSEALAQQPTSRPPLPPLVRDGDADMQSLLTRDLGPHGPARLYRHQRRLYTSGTPPRHQHRLGARLCLVTSVWQCSRPYASSRAPCINVAALATVDEPKSSPSPAALLHG